MATIAENLLELQTTKANIKTAIESKGQDLTDVPFTQYADKISAIQTGGAGGEDELIKSFVDGSITSVSIPSGTTLVKEYCFYKQTNLENVTIPNTVTNIKDYAFYDCSKLKEIVIPDSVKQLGSYVFYTCDNLASVTIGTGLTILLSSCFAYCPKLTQIIIPDKITSIGSSCFSNCGLTSIIIPDKITSLPNACFMNCSNLTKVTFGSGVATIQSQAFQNCTSCLEYDFTKCLQVPRLSGTNAFTGINENCKIYVPDALYDEWIVKTNWSTYASYIAKASEMPA